MSLPPTDEPLLSSFGALAGPATRVLVLGSLPGAISLKRGEYYGNPRNRFWDLIGLAIGVAMPAAYADRLEVLAAHGVGLWDVVGQARRVGSLDAAIRDHQPNPLRAFVASLPALRTVAFNGGKAWEIGSRQLAAQQGPALIRLPSSSPAYTLAFAQKAEAWRQLGDFL